MRRKCQLCKKEFEVKDKRAKFCSIDCSRKGQSRPAAFKKGNKVNIGRKLTRSQIEAVRNAHLGVKLTSEHKEKIAKGIKQYRKSDRSQDHKYNKGEKHPNWKGQKVSYRNCHEWVRRNYNKTGRCKHCGKFKKTEWANIDHEYNRIREDWLELCRSCHIKFDRVNNF